MSFTLYLNKDKWYTHWRKMSLDYPDFLPVIKGNGYGFGNTYLANTARELGKNKVAVGTLEEARSLQALGLDFAEILVLTPVLSELRPEDFAACVFTVGNHAQLDYLGKTALGLKTLGQEIPTVRLVLKCQSTMRRYGFTPSELRDAGEKLSALSQQLPLEIKGYSIHFPLEGLGEQDKLAQVASWLGAISELGLGGDSFYISHVSPELYRAICSAHPDFNFVMRLGTALWLSEKSAYRFRSTVLAVQEIRRGQTYGYKQKKARSNGYLLYVAGGSANGIGLESPQHSKSLKDRLKLTAFWLLTLFNRNLSPFVYQGKRVWFAEPPHMQTTVLHLPAGTQPPAVGTEIELKNLRMTIASFDRIVEVSSENEETRVYFRSE